MSTTLAAIRCPMCHSDELANPGECPIADRVVLIRHAHCLACGKLVVKINRESSSTSYTYVMSEYDPDRVEEILTQVKFQVFRDQP